MQFNKIFEHFSLARIYMTDRIHIYEYQLLIYFCKFIAIDREFIICHLNNVIYGFPLTAKVSYICCSEYIWGISNHYMGSGAVKRSTNVKLTLKTHIFNSCTQPIILNKEKCDLKQERFSVHCLLCLFLWNIMLLNHNQ